MSFANEKGMQDYDWLFYNNWLFNFKNLTVYINFYIFIISFAMCRLSLFNISYLFVYHLLIFLSCIFDFMIKCFFIWDQITRA